MAGKFETSQSKNGKFLFNLKAGYGQVIGCSEMHASDTARANGITAVKSKAPQAPTKDLTEA